MMHAEGPVALRHVNAPALIRCGVASVAVLRDRRQRNALKPPEWEDLLRGAVVPWELASAEAVEEYAETLSLRE